jgi:DNA-directed RNA polymerase II subunit RPB1
MNSSGLDKSGESDLFSRYKGPEDDTDELSPVVKNMIEINTRNAEDILPTVIIRDLLYSAYDQEELSRCSIIIDKTENDALYGHINDPRMGVAENRKRCKTCGNDNINCTGHYGVIVMPYPIYHPLFIGYTIKILNMVCSKCSRLKMDTKIRENLLFLMRSTNIYKPNKEQRLRRNKLLNESMYQELYSTTGFNRLRRLIDGNFIRECPVHGSNINIKYKQAGNTNSWNQVICEYDTPEAGNVKSIPPIEDVQNIVKNIPSDDILVMGFQNNAKPVNWILNYWVVLPPNDRPPVKHDVTSVWKDQLTRMYEHILKIRANIEKLKPNISEADKVNLMNRLYFCISHFIDNSDKQYAQGPKGVPREFITLKQLIQGKEALIRNLMMGKRVNYTARTVLSPDPTLRFGQIRLPLEWAQVLTKQVYVTSLNLEHVKKLLAEGKITHYKKGSGPDKGSRHQIILGKTYIPEIGDEVTRWLQNGDYVIFNRQPTLHRFGFMAMEVVLADDDDIHSIGLPLAYAKAFNFDFDGDEGNIHDLQTIGANVESMTIANVVNMIMNPKENKPMMAILYNGLVGVHLLTQPDTVVDKDIFIDCISSITERYQLDSLADRLDKAGVYGLSGRALFSALLPEDFTYSKGEVRIINGVLLSGVIGKSHVGMSQNSIISQLHKDYPVSRVVNFLSDLPFVLDRWMITRNYSLGYADCRLNIQDFEEKRNKLIREAQMKIDTRDGSHGTETEKEHYEQHALRCLENVKSEITGMVMKNMNRYNAFDIINASGAKNLEANMIEATAIVGQQLINDVRPKANGRCLPYFEYNSTDIKSQGYCVNSYITGLTPPELYFLQAAGRKGLMDTAINTAITGSLHHKIVKALEKLKVAEDGSTRNANNKIFQYTYGDDSFDPEFLVPVVVASESFLSFTDIKANVNSLNAKYGKYTHKDIKVDTVNEDDGDWSKKTETPKLDGTFVQKKIRGHRKHMAKDMVAREISVTVKKLSDLQKTTKVDPSIFTATETHGSRYEKKVAKDVLTDYPPTKGESEMDYVERVLRNLQ